MQVSTPTIVVVGSNHEYAPVDIREQLAFSGDQLARGLNALQQRVPEGLILSTCNRTEIYAVGQSDEQVVAEIFGFLSGYHSVTEPMLRRSSYVLSGEQAVDHFFRVASGLNSMILGEPQILSQIREALDLAREQNAVGPMLQRLTLDALRIGKRARTETDIARNRVSIAHAAVDLAERELNGLSGLSVAILGAGKMATLAAKLLRARGASEISVVNRSVDRARELAESVDGVALPLTALEDAIASAHLVIGAAVSDGPLISAAHVAPRNTPVLMIDLSVPRVVDQAVGHDPLVQVRDVDALDPIAEENRRRYSSEVRKVETLVLEATRNYERWVESRRGVQAIAAVRARAEAIRDLELDKALRRLQHLSDRDQNIVRVLACGLTNKLLHQPVQELRAVGDVDQRQAILRAFGVEEPDT
ncbi:MAG TPA: glutamyl-tRNA reductase [Thermomicrobiales bacterium]|nr:glutamyl-tRNA reductase [Thermomicrobiales bacterium]